jgi:juvenile hormone epoxide hydrolase
MMARLFPSLFLNEEERDSSSVCLNFGLLLRETGYVHIHMFVHFCLTHTGASLSNSPSGLAAYILEKFSGWTNGDWISEEDGGLIPYFNIGDFLDNVMIYWVTSSITRSMRLYSEYLSPRQSKHNMDR